MSVTCAEDVTVATPAVPTPSADHASSLLPDLDPGAAARRRRRLRHRLAVAAAAVLGTAAIVYLARNLVLGTPVAVYLSERSDLDQTVVATGRVITPARIVVGAEIAGRVARIPVGEGQRVDSGQVLVALDNHEQRAAVAQAQAVVDEASARLRALDRHELPSAQQALLQAQSEAELAGRRLKRIATLRAQGFVSDAEVDDARNAADIAASRMRGAQLAVAAKSPGGSDEEVARTALAQGRAALALKRTGLDRTSVLAPRAGILITRSVEAGDVVQPGRELMTLSADGETQLSVAIDEKSLALLAPGQKAVASADAFPDQRFAAELFYINPGVDPLRGAVEVKLRVADPPAYLRPDMTVSVDIGVAHRSQVVVLPADAIRHDSGRAWVLTLEDGRALRREVRVGVMGEGKVEVVEGLDDGIAVIPPSAGAMLAPGQRVRVAP